MGSTNPSWIESKAAMKAVLAAIFILGAYWPLKTFFAIESVAERDFGSLWASGHAIRSGINPYDLKAYDAFGDRLLGAANYNFTYPPHILFLLLPLSFLPPLAALITWNVASAILFWWAARAFIPKGMPSWLALLTPGALINFNYGQTGLLCSALFLLAFRGSGLAAAALTIKPHMGFLVIPAMLRDRRTFTIAAVATIALVLASALAFGGWFDFVAHARNIQGEDLANMKVAWIVKGTTPAIGYGLWGWILFAVGGAYFLSRNFNVFTAATATFLISPYGLHYDMAALCLGFAILLFSRRQALSFADKIAASLAFLTPVIVVYAMTWAIPPILLWGLLVQTEWTDGVRLQLGFGERGRRKLQFHLAKVSPGSSKAGEPAPAIAHMRQPERAGAE